MPAITRPSRRSKAARWIIATTAETIVKLHKSEFASLPCALAGAEPFCDAITSTGSGLRIIHETCMARCWMAPVRNGRRRRHIRYRPLGDGESLEWCATHFEQRNFVRLYECCRIRRSQKLSRQATFCREHRLCVVCFSARSIRRRKIFARYPDARAPRCG